MHRHPSTGMTATKHEVLKLSRRFSRHTLWYQPSGSTAIMDVISGLNSRVTLLNFASRHCIHVFAHHSAHQLWHHDAADWNLTPLRH